MKKKTAKRHALGSGKEVSAGREKRCGLDRRSNKKASLKFLLFNGRREGIRREEDREKVFFFDRYNPKLFAAIMAILMLSLFDGLLTLYLVSNGSSELNPVMAYFMKSGPFPFVVAKYLLTTAGVLVLLVFKNVFLTGVNIYTHSLFSCMIAAFSAVIIWEMLLIYLSP